MHSKHNSKKFKYPKKTRTILESKRTCCIDDCNNRTSLFWKFLVDGITRYGTDSDKESNKCNQPQIAR